MPVFNNILAGAAGQAGGAAAAGPIKSVRINSADNAKLTRTPSSAGNRKTWTWAGWVKLNNSSSNFFLGAGTTGTTNYTYARFGVYLDKIQFLTYSQFIFTSDAVFRDYSGWGHITLVCDTTESTAADRLKVYWNGVQLTNSATTTLDSNGEYAFNNTLPHTIGSESIFGTWDGYLADLYFIDGQALDPTSFGAFDDNGVWQAAAYSGTYGNNGYHLFDFANESGIGNDSSGNDNDFTVNNISSTAGEGNDLLRDVPTNGSADDDTGAGGEVSGNYCTWNPLSIRNGGTGTLELLDGNLNFGDQGTNNRYGSVAGTIAVNSGKWFFEITYGSGTGVNNDSYIGLMPVELLSTYNTNGYFNVVGSIALRNDKAYKKGEATQPVYATGVAIGDTISIAFDCDTGSSTWYLNGTSLGAFPFTFDTQYSYTPFAVDWSNDTPISEFILNCGQRAFSMTAPTGYKPICTAMLPDPTIADGSDYFDVATWAGNSSTQSITGLGFQPDFLWYKSLSAYHYGVQDAVRGVGKSLSPSRIDVAEQTETTGLDAFTSDGFDLDGDGFYYINKSGQNFVGWAWNGGGSTVSNTDGTLTSSVRASQTAGTSIVTYTGSGSATSVGHGLNATPDAIIVKNRDTTSLNWAVYHSGLPANESVALNLAWGYTSIADHFDAPSSTVFNIASDDTVNKSGDDFVAYCFSSVEGFSKFGTYVGTGASGSPFVYLGFKPALLIIKKQSSGNWFIHDYKRPGYNQNTGPLRIAAEAELTVTTYDLDILSNGFVMRTTGGDANGSGSNYIYFAWAENPFQNNGGLAR